MVRCTRLGAQVSRTATGRRHVCPPGVVDIGASLPGKTQERARALLVRSIGQLARVPSGAGRPGPVARSQPPTVLGCCGGAAGSTRMDRAPRAWPANAQAVRSRRSRVSCSGAFAVSVTAFRARFGAVAASAWRSVNAGEARRAALRIGQLIACASLASETVARPSLSRKTASAPTPDCVAWPSVPARLRENVGTRCAWLRPVPLARDGVADL